MKKADYVSPSTMTISFDHMENAVYLDMDDEISFAEALGMLEFAKMLVITKWQQENSGRIGEVRYEDEDFDEDDWDDEDEE